MYICIFIICIVCDDIYTQQPVEKARRRTLKWEKVTAISKTINGYNNNQRSQPMNIDENKNKNISNQNGNSNNYGRNGQDVKMTNKYQNGNNSSSTYSNNTYQQTTV